MSKYIRLIRPLHWIKNLLCFAGVIFSGKFSNYQYLASAVLVFFAFSITASSIYILNDLIDADKDRLHLTKKNRPIAAKEISPAKAWSLFLGLLLLAVIISWKVSAIVLMLMLCYVGLNIAYSLKLKHIPILDVFIISSGFILRLLAGTIGINISPTEWIIVCTLMLSLFFGFVKRYCEIKCTKGETRAVILKYSGTALEKLISITASCSILSYSIFVINKHQPWLLITIIPVSYAIFHVILDLNVNQKGENFSKDLFTNYHILSSLLVWVAAYCLINFNIRWH